MSVNNLGTFLNIKDSHLRVVSGNVYAQGINIGGITVDVAHGLQSITNQGNVTTNTLQFDNATTGFTTTANVTVGRDLTVTGNALVSSNLTVTGNAVISDDLTVTGNTFYANPASVLVDSNVVTEYTGPHDRPLRKYPEVALTTDDNSSTSGYVVDKSEESSSGDAYAAYRAFDGIIPDGTTTIGWRTDSGYNQDTGLADGGVTRFTGDSGEWVELQLPNSIKLSSIVLKVGNQGNNLANSQRRFPKVFVIYGYNGTSWDRIQEYTTSAIQSLTDVQTFHISNPTAYHNKFVLVVKQTYSVTGATSGVTNIGELEYYGYEEGSGSLDTTLKSVYNVPATTGTQLEVYYDGQDYTGVTSMVNDKAGTATNATISNAGGTITFNDEYKAWTFGGDTTRTDTFTSPISSSIQGNIPLSASLWFKTSELNSGSLISLAPSTGEATNQVFGVRLDSSTETDFSFLFWNNDIRYSIPENTLIKDNWYHLTATYDGTNRNLYVNGVRLTVVSTFGANLYDDLALPSSNLQLQLGRRNNGDNEFFGSIANFRLYSKALNAGQIQELYDYQKDYFLGSKSQVTLYKGHLGVGVTEPSGQLELAGDERIQEYPPRGMTDFDTYIEGHGVFKASATSHGGSIGTSKYHAWKAFNKDRTDANNGDNSWLNGPDISGGDYNTSTGVYEGTEKHHGGAPIGAALQLSMPYEIYLKGYSLAPWNYATGTDFQYADSPSDFIIYGSKDNVNWVQIDSRTGQGMSSQTDIKRFSLDTRDSYSHFAIVVTKNNTAAYPSTSASFVAIEEWRLFGTPGPTTLDKGSLSLGRSLDVPRISRYDVDTETPRPEKLVVDFDTTVNSSPTDISGRGNHGTFNGTDMNYSSADKAFVFNGTDDYIGAESISFVGGFNPFTISLWVNVKVNTGHIGLTQYGVNASNDSIGLKLVNGQDEIEFFFYSNDVRFTWTPVLNRWYHLVANYDGGTDSGVTGGQVGVSRKIWVDGVELLVAPGTRATAGTVTQPSLPANSALTIGARIDGTESVNGKISNFKLYNVALEPSEVKKLYNLGRTGRSMVISDTAVGIGKVPEAQLDVRGDLRVGGRLFASVPYYAARQRNTNSYVFDESIVYDQYVYTNYPGSFVANSATDGYYQPPMNGMYQVHMECIVSGSGNILIQRRTGTTVDLSHDERHVNYTLSGWMSTSADALIPITNCVTQNIRIYIDGTGGNGAWQYNTYHGSAFFLWVSDIPERRQHHVA